MPECRWKMDRSHLDRGIWGLAKVPQSGNAKEIGVNTLQRKRKACSDFACREGEEEEEVEIAHWFEEMEPASGQPRVWGFLSGFGGFGDSRGYGGLGLGFWMRIGEV
uniref:Uncharacterized protein n=1 Tax=Cannabis sativa TaxID=3483 RepID=A0A803NTC4_CANSA